MAAGAALGLALLPRADAHAADLTILTSSDPALKLGEAAFPGGKTLDLSVGIGSGAFHAPADPANIIYTVSDRGPNIDCSDAEKLVGLSIDQICKGDKAGKIFATPDFVPSIFVVELAGDASFKIAKTIPLATSDGKPITGLPNPLKAAKTEKGYDREGNLLPFDVNGLDTEGIVKLADGSFWIADEYGPSVLHVAADGRIQERLVPAGLDADLAGAGYAVNGSLPPILLKRTLNRGIEGIAISPDEKFLYAMVQSPLSNPDADAYKKSRQTRLIKVDLAQRKTVGEFVFVEDTPDSFAQDQSEKQNDVRLSELTALGTDDLVVLERIDRTTKLQRISLAGATNILGSAWDDAATSPSLEQTAAEDLAAGGVTPVSKTLWFDSAKHEGLPAKIEGVTITGDGALLLINDDDFGIAGDRTKIVLLPAPATN
jgi:hypothetical protein